MKSYLSQVLQLVVPNVASFIVSFISTLVTALCISRLDRAELLASVGLGNLLSNTLGYSIGLGLISVLDTVISQSAGSGNFHLSLVHLTRGRLVCLVIVIPCTLALFFSGKLLLFLGQDEATARYSEQFTRWTAPGLLPYFLFEADCSYLRAHHINNPQLVVNCLCAVFQLGLCVLLVNGLGLEMVGAGLSLTVTYWLQWALLQMYVRFGRLNTDIRDGCSFHSFVREVVDEFAGVGHARMTFCPVTGVYAGLREFLWLQLNSALTMWIEWWIYEVMALIAGNLSVNVLAAHVVCVNVEAAIYVIPMAFQQAASVLVGNSLGAGQPRQAAHYGKLCVGMSAVGNVLIGIIVYRYRVEICKIYTSDENVLVLLEPGMTLIAFFQGIDGLNCVLEGVLRGLRLQEKAVIAKASVMTFIQLPLAYYWGNRIGLIGIWLAASLGFGTSCAIYAVIILRADFIKCAMNTMKQTNQYGLLTKSDVQVEY